MSRKPYKLKYEPSFDGDDVLIGPDMRVHADGLPQEVIDRLNQQHKKIESLAKLLEQKCATVLLQAEKIADLESDLRIADNYHNDYRNRAEPLFKLTTDLKRCLGLGLED